MTDDQLSGYAPKDPHDPRLDGLGDKLRPKMKRVGADFPFIREIIALWRFWKDPKQPWSKRAIAAAALLYFVSPFDLIPDFLPGGYLDDVIVITLALSHLAEAIKPYLPPKDEVTATMP